MHGGVNVTDNNGSQMSVAFVFRVMGFSRQYDIYTDRMKCTNQEKALDADHLFDRFDVDDFHEKFVDLYQKIFVC